MRLPPRQQGDLGEFAAAEWLSSQGYAIYLPFGHSPHCDLIAEQDEVLIRVQVKTSTCYIKNGRYAVTICTRGGNQSWSGLVKYFSPARCDHLFVLVADGRRWFIPARVIDAQTSMIVGGPKFAEYEVERGRPIPTAIAA